MFHATITLHRLNDRETMFDVLRHPWSVDGRTKRLLYRSWLPNGTRTTIDVGASELETVVGLLVGNDIEFTLKYERS